ncbi:BT_3928 family protein [Paraflavisolibacter sp. H34]|uniref:BT_3928 family protein n=1 Tax=Huijunlia imazamoxiresistens TaxID=3127457 RepID=UPI003019407B
MKTLTNVIRVFVGVLFIISGLVKVNDPLGLTYKMQEFFEIWNAGLATSGFFLKSPLMALFDFLHEHSLALSVAMNALEIMAGVALLLGWARNFVLKLLLLLMVFFTFLTAYAYLSGKFRSCGCFGDCLPIPPFTSFLKDVLLLVMIIFLNIYQRYILPVAAPPVRTAVLGLFLLISLGGQWYVLNYLPVVDCLPFKKGANILRQMQIPPGSIPDSFAIRFVYEKGGKQFEFSPEQLPADLGTYTFKERTDKLVRQGNAEPPIKGFALMGPNMDSTRLVMAQPACLLLFWENQSRPLKSWAADFQQVSAAAAAKGLPVYVATAMPVEKAADLLARNGITNVQLFSCDVTAIRTAARTNPCLYLLKGGTVQEKYSYREMEKVVGEL